MKYLLGIVCIALVLGGFLLWKRWKEQKEERVSYQEKIKDKVLDEAIKNNTLALKQLEKESILSLEEQIQNDNKKSKDQECVIVELTVHSKAGEQNYILNPEKTIHIGSEKGRNDLVLQDEKIAKKQCEIFLHNREVYVKKIDQRFGVWIQRKEHYKELEESAIKLMTGDKLYMNNYQILIVLMDYMGNVISG
ncbi:FHA domain-containing protein [Brotaphodocola sp.]|uniref:FHA domain-containing protein n=1 Tax=Brotaphodocola sp. TaxID=3073577 RepID=UPI003D7DC10A